MWTYQLNTPPEQSSLEVLGIGERPALNDGNRVNNGEATVELAPGNVVVQVLRT